MVIIIMSFQIAVGGLSKTLMNYIRRSVFCASKAGWFQYTGHESDCLDNSSLQRVFFCSWVFEIPGITQNIFFYPRKSLFSRNKCSRVAERPLREKQNLLSCGPWSWRKGELLSSEQSLEATKPTPPLRGHSWSRSIRSQSSNATRLQLFQHTNASHSVCGEGHSIHAASIHTIIED